MTNYNKTKAPGKEMECDSPTGVRSGEDEIEARRVEMISNPAYETLTCKSTTPDMVDEYDCELMNEVYHYSRSSGVVSTEDEIAARRVEMTANPAYGTATSKSTSPDVVDENDYEFPELNKQKTCDNPSQLKDPELIDTYDSVYDSASIEPNKEVVYYDCPTGVGSGEDDLEARKVEFTILEDWISK